jgi:hypothetical protein
MATTTPNFGWAVPTSTDLVKDGAVAIETLGDSIDASLVDLKGGTTGQVLAKASGTDMDFSWVTDATGIPATILDAKGDIIAATAADTASRLAVGANNTVLTADSSTATGLKWATPAAATSGMTKVTSGSFTNVASVSVDNCFTGTYRNYLLMYRHKAVSATNSQCSFKYRNGGVDTSTGYYFGFVGLSDTGTTVNLNTSNGTSVTLSLADSTEGGAGNFYIYEPAVSGSKFALGQIANNGQSYYRSGGFQRSQSSGTFDGFSLIFTSNNSTGTYTVYGLEN